MRASLPAALLALGGAALLCAGRGQLLGSRAAPVPPRGGGGRPDRVPASVWAERRWAELLAEVGAEGDARRWARVALGALALVGLVGGLVLGPVGALVAVAVAISSAGAVRPVLVRRRALRADALLPELVEQAARALRSGLDLVPALEVAAATAGGDHGVELARVVARHRAGAPLRRALGPWAASHPRPPVRLTVAALEVAAGAGGPRARALDGVAASIRSREAVRREVRALASQASASAVVLVALPLVVGLFSALADPRLAHTLVGTPAGVGCITAAVALDLVGALWMRRVLRAVGA